ncbi:SpoIIE family protein phosphatase [Pseudodesulfovibrio sp.]|uniref:SpoIIE family protein phosphatase n=1 Tax=Pseudodesulfovibrio sp. TaxID=2035812 RepID=UPI00260DFB32|nr:SpoIIE family protein phosphatase [Pseudodesulfovibrio sp.]MDD3312979.1 SpoIIE family protein phosphatase [Pseudodesulfovibrio sp.]
MRMPIRFKFFIVLLAFSLAPMFISRTLMGRTVLNMGHGLANTTRQELLEIVTAELEHNAATMLEGLEESSKTMILGATVLANRASEALGRPGDPAGTVPRLGAGHHTELPADAAPRGDYVKKTMMGGARQLRVSLESASFRSVGEAVPADLRQMARLESLLPTFRRIYQILADDSVWLNIGLESGVFMTYPGHNDFPRRYDHREQDWYRRARDSGRGYVWTTPWIDPATRRAVATVSCPIRDASGRFLGAAAVDVPNASVLDDSVLSSRWSEHIRSFLVARALNAETLQEGLLILAQQAYDKGGHRRMMEGIQAEWLEGEVPAIATTVIKAMDKQRVGHVRVDFEGEPSVLAWASNPDFSFLLLAPESVVNRLPDHMAGQMNATFVQMRQISAGVAGLILLVVGLIAWFGSRAITRPLLSMVHVVKRLAAGDFSARMEHHPGDEREALVAAFNEMGPKLRERMEMRRDLELAQEVQNLLLPRSEPDLPGWDIAGGIHFCDQTGGDYYDFIPVPDGEGPGLDVVLGDVSGHGAASALVMATTRGQLHSLAGAPLSPEERIRIVNEVLARDLDGTGRFLTLFYLHLTGDSGQARWVRAGHDPAVRFDPSSGTFGELGGEGLALGVLEGYPYQGYSATLASGEVVVMATDGVWEARDASGGMFGKQRMLAIIRESAHKSALDLREAIMDAVHAFQETQQDDIAVVVVKRIRG